MNHKWLPNVRPRKRKKQSGNLNNYQHNRCTSTNAILKDILLEIRKGNKKPYAASIYMDYKEKLKTDITKTFQVEDK